MDLFGFDERPASRRFSLRSLFGVHSVAAAFCEFVAKAPLIAGLFAIAAAFVLLQMGVLAACTWHVPRRLS